MRELKKISPEQLRQILAGHDKWLDTKGKEGAKADLQGTDLAGADLAGAHLCRVDLSGADLAGANLSEAKLQGAFFRYANLKNTILIDADLQDANFQDVRGFSIKQLAGTNALGIKLPEVADKLDHGLERMAEKAKNARRYFYLMILGCFYSLLVIATTTDVNLITNSPASLLPVIGAAIPIAGFYLVAPIMLFGIYVCFHIYLQRLWENYAFQPAVFPDGKPLYRKAHPWFLDGLVYPHFKYIKETSPIFSKLQNAISKVFVRWLVPITLWCFWWRYLPRHHWLTYLHIAILLASKSFSIKSRFIKVKTLSEKKRVRWGEVFNKGIAVKSAGILAISGLFLFLSLKASNGVRAGGPSGSSYFDYFLDLTAADLARADISKKPSNWTGSEVDLVKGAFLAGCNLKRLIANHAFLDKADLHNADLSGADLEAVSLRKANLKRSNLAGANLRQADLGQADLAGANLAGANLAGANLEEVDLGRANLQKADFKGAVLLKADLGQADLKGADFERADLRAAGLGQADLEGTNFHKANLEGAVLTGANLKDANLVEANIQKANLEQAVLTRANLHRADLREANLEGASFKGAYMEGADLWDTQLHGADFQKARLVKARFHRANLSNADFQEADLTKANLQDTNLIGADFQGARLQGANFWNADLSSAHFEGTNLTNVRNLTKEQIESALIDEKTILPHDLRQ